MPETSAHPTTLGGKYRMGDRLRDVPRCPHCSIATPNLVAVWVSEGATTTSDGTPTQNWGCYKCDACGSVVAARALLSSKTKQFETNLVIPSAREAHEDLPSGARSYLQQAFDTLHAPDAAAVMAGSAVDAMLKAKGFSDKSSLYTRIDQALEANILTQGMAEWAHSVRLGSNRPRHADNERPHVSPEEAKQSVEFAEALGSFLFVLTAKIERGIAQAAEASSNAPQD